MLSTFAKQVHQPPFGRGEASPRRGKPTATAPLLDSTLELSNAWCASAARGCYSCSFLDWLNFAHVRGDSAQTGNDRRRCRQWRFAQRQRSGQFRSFVIQGQRCTSCRLARFSSGWRPSGYELIMRNGATREFRARMRFRGARFETGTDLGGA